MEKILKKLKTPIEIVKIIAKYEPVYFAFSVPQIIIRVALTFLAVYFPKLIIDHLTNSQQYISVISTISLYIILLLVLTVINCILENNSALHASVFAAKLKKKVGYNAMHLELKDIEQPQMRDVIRLAGRAAELPGTMNILEGIISNIIAVLGLAWMILRLDSLFVVLVLITLAIKTVFVRIDYRHIKKSRILDAENNRIGDYLNGISFFNEGAEKEIRLNSLQDWYMRKVSGFRQTMLRIQYGNYKRSAVFNIIMAAVIGVQSFLVLWGLSKMYISSIISIADFTMYFSAVNTLSLQLSAISEKMGLYDRQALDLSEYEKLLSAVQTFFPTPNNANKSFSIPPNTEIIFHSVSFIYPNTDKEVLKNINITISDREKLVIVGANGSGKSTFIKLLCKFYRPTSGKITLNGIDIWDIPNDVYTQILSAVFQDFKNFSFTLKENIAMCENADEVAVKSAIDAVGLSECIENLPQKEDTYLNRLFSSEGIELSGGQAQKLAISRAIYKDSSIFILDEPTSNLDPKAESEIYSDLFNMVKEKTAIFISHRLAASSIADNIAVFQNGSIVEYGNHEYLLKQSGLYAEMFKKQAQHYN